MNTDKARRFDLVGLLDAATGRHGERIRPVSGNSFRVHPGLSVFIRVPGLAKHA
jgi:hypothetical protein